ncbi:DNA primase catalytic subunit PriS [Halobacteriales archaeon QS_1_68_20]|nr:MAG: DNA primase catalytic subunit PriS [Halobacteriales archaeon QS_1_68_20]
MEGQTRAYLRGRFGDHYRRAGVSPPPAAGEREWGYIPFRAGETRMVRHRSLLDLGDFGDAAELGEFLARERPRHVYYSAARYDDPGADSMDAKGWQAADLVFDLDADHLPAVDPAEDSYAEMLSACKDALVRLLDFLEGDFGFEDLSVVFSGGRGYHVHVRDEGVLDLGRDQRREIVDYVLGEDLDFESLVDTETVAGLGRKTPAEKRTIPTGGGWGARVHDRLMTVVDEALALPDDEGVDRLTRYVGVGEGRAEAILAAADANYDELAAGNVDVHPALHELLKAIRDETVQRERAPIDEPVTTDLNRLIRLPGSIHGGSGLRVTPVDREDLAEFDPFVHAVPGTFRGQEIVVDVKSPGETPFAPPSGDDTFTVSADEQSVPEYVGVFLMARGRAEKGKER